MATRPGVPYQRLPSSAGSAAGGAPITVVGGVSTTVVYVLVALTILALICAGVFGFFAVQGALDNSSQDSSIKATQFSIDTEKIDRATADTNLQTQVTSVQNQVNDRIASINQVRGENLTHNVDLIPIGPGLSVLPNETTHEIGLSTSAILDVNGVPPISGVGSLLLDGIGMIDIISTANTSTVTVDGSMIVTQLSNLQAQVSMQQVEILELQTNQTQVQTVVDALVAALSAISGGMNGTQDLNMTITQLVVNVTMATINIAQLQAQVANLTMNEPMPGMLIPYGGAAGGPYPAGWLLCDGTEYNILDYPALHAVIGTMYCPGPCSSINVFAVPDMRGRTIVHKGGSVLNTAIATKLGAETHVLTVGELASHSHGGSTSSVDDHIHTNGWLGSQLLGCDDSYPFCRRQNSPFPYTYRPDWPIGSTDSNFVTGQSETAEEGANYPNIYRGNMAGAGGHSHTISAQGSGAAHNNIQPSMVMQYLIKT